MIKTIDHITINITDLEATLNFYGTVLEFERIGDVDRGDHYLRYFLLPGGIKLELIEYFYDTRGIPVCNTDKGLLRHIAFEVDNIRVYSELMKKHGIRIIEEISKSEELGVYYMLIQDPNGVELEFVEKL